MRSIARNGASALALVWVLAAAPAWGAGEGWQVSVAPEFFNPTTGQTATFEVTGPGHPVGRLRIEVLDRDRVVVRELPPQLVGGWPVRVVWDGRDVAGRIVPNEAYTLRLTLREGKAAAVFDPSRGLRPSLEQPVEHRYSVLSGVISYRLPRASRVLIRVGQAVPDPKTGKMTGPILKTVVDREPRVAGTVSEAWNGYDESGEVPVHTLPHLAMSIFATSLPEATVITVGSRGPAFRDYAATRPGKAPATPARAPGAQYAGLLSHEDVSPVLGLSISGGRDEQNVPVVRDGLDLTVALPRQANAGFARLPARMWIFLDEQIVMETAPRDGMKVHVSTLDLAPGDHRVVANWMTTGGPVGLGVARIRKRAESPREAQR